jgi:hypothetical protein
MDEGEQRRGQGWRVAREGEYTSLIRTLSVSHVSGEEW